MTEKLFDSFVKDKLKNHSSPVPGELWKKIAAGKGVTRPNGFLKVPNTALIAAIGFTVVLLTGGYFIFNSQKQDQPDYNSAKKVNSGNGLAENNSGQKKLSDSNGSVTGPTNSPDASKKEGASIKEDLRDREMHSTDRKTDLNNNGKTSASSEELAINRKKPSTNKNAMVAGINSAPSLSDIIKQASGSNTFPVKNKKAPTIPAGYHSAFANNTTTSQPASSNVSPSDQSLSSLSKTGSYGELVRVGEVNNLYNINNPQLIPPFNIRSVLGLGYDCPSASGRQRKNWFLEIYASPDYSIKFLSGNGLSNIYLQKKDSTERRRLGYTAGARISTELGDHFMLKTGLQYSQINEHFSQRIENETQTITVIVSHTISRPQGDTTYKDTTSVTQIGYAVKSSRNHYSNLEIPVSLGYEFGHERDSWKLAVNGGAIFNVTSFYSGETLDTSFNIVSISSKNNDGFSKKEVGLSLFGSLSLIHNINNYLDIFAEPYFRYSLSNLSSSIGYSQRFNTLGLMFGVRMKLNNKQHF